MTHPRPVTRRPWTTGDVRLAARLHAQGCSSREIARLMGRACSSVLFHLARHVPPPARTLAPAPSTTHPPPPAPPSFPRGRYPRSPWHRATARERAERARAEAARAACARLGWPEVVRAPHARVLDVLARHGPLSHGALAGVLGYRLRRDNGRSDALAWHLATLGRMRYVVATKTAGLRGPLYAVAPWLLARRS